MKVAIIGGGAIGLLTAYYLCEKHDVTVVTRTEAQRDLINNSGICVVRNGKQHWENNVSAQDFLKENILDNSLWIIALKQTALDSFLKKWEGQQRLPRMLFLQNGMGHLEQATELLRTPPPLYGGVVTHGALKTSDNIVHHKGQGEMWIGAWESSFQLHDILSENTYYPIRETPDLKLMMKRKLLVNMIVNPLTSLYGIKNGELLKRKSWLENVRILFNEGIAVLGLPQEEWGRVIRVIEQTSENESSMLRDIQQGRSTEIQAITGYILDTAIQKNIDVPMTAFLHRSIIGLEKRI